MAHPWCRVRWRLTYVFDYGKNTITGFGSILRTSIMVASHATRKRDTILYPEQPVPVPPRFRGRIVLTRDPDGDERCVACNLCAVACPVGCISLQKAEREDGRWYPEFSVLIFRVVSFVVCVKKRARQRLFR